MVVLFSISSERIVRLQRCDLFMTTNLILFAPDLMLMVQLYMSMISSMNDEMEISRNSGEVDDTTSQR